MSKSTLTSTSPQNPSDVIVTSAELPPRTTWSASASIVTSQRAAASSATARQ